MSNLMPLHAWHWSRDHDVPTETLFEGFCGRLTRRACRSRGGFSLRRAASVAAGVLGHVQLAARKRSPRCGHAGVVFRPWYYSAL
jgi:hypothetical protein